MGRAFGRLPDHRLFRYALAFVGPAATAGAQFALSLTLVRTAAAASFGSFAFLLILNQFCLGIWAALFGAALPVIVGDRDPAVREAQTASMFAVNLLAGAPLLAAVAAVAMATGVAAGAAWCFSLFSALSMWRGFARAYCYAVGRQWRVALSDVAYGAIVLAASGAMLAAPPRDPLLHASAGLATGAAAGLLLFGRLFWRQQARALTVRAVRGYRAIWRVHAGWSLLGVLTTEATLNAHAYVVTWLAGPGAFAVLAASALLTRPVSVILSALGEFERANMAGEIARGDMASLARSVRFFRAIMLLVWVATGLVTYAVLAFAAGRVFPAIYAPRTLAIGAALWTAVMLVRLVRAPESAMLQGAGSFRPLAFGSIWSAAISVAAVALLVETAAPVWSIGGVLLGDLVFAAMLWRIARRWRRGAVWEGAACA